MKLMMMMWMMMMMLFWVGGGDVGEDQNSGDVMGGGPSNVENDDDHQVIIIIPVYDNSKPKKTRFHWSNYIKDCIKKELADCIGPENLKYLTPARANEFLEKHNLGDRTYGMLKNIIYNMTRPPRTK